MKTIQQITQGITDAIREAAKKSGYNLKDVRLVFPPSVNLGTFAVDFFRLSKELKSSPAEIAQKIGAEIISDGVIQEVSPVGPYLNLKVSNNLLFSVVCSEILERGEAFGNSGYGRGKKVMVEYLSPNTNKPLHLGHMRNGSLGMALSGILESSGFRVIKANLINDRGVHICKSMLAWLKWGNGETPESTGIKGDHFVGKWYVRYAIEAEKDPNLEKEVQEMLQKWEAGDPEVISLWKEMNKWVYDGFSQTYKNFGLEFNEFFYESDTYKLGKDTIVKGLGAGVFHRDGRGNVVFDLPEAKFGLNKDGKPKSVTLLRPDGTSLYITQDIGTAILKMEKFDLDRSVYVVGSEQIHHFQCLFEILRALGYDWAGELFHLSYGMVYLPEGKMKSREGKVVDADNLINEIQEMAAEEIKKRYPEGEITEEEMTARAHVIAIGAIKFYLLRVKPSQDIHFDPKESLSFEGFTGPYCQYAFARISGILRNAQAEGIDLSHADFSLLGNNEELLLLQKLIQFPAEAESATRELSPLKVINQVFEIAKAFNQFYNAHPVLQAGNAELVSARLKLIMAAAVVIKKGLKLLGIDTLERM